jgi:APA family basic amino acid/polyamine antiporter
LASGIGIIVGAGIYVLIGEATAEAGGTVWLAFLIAAGLSALTALSYAELAAMYPTAAAEYEYTRHAFPQLLAFLVGWVMIAGLTVAAAAVSLGFAQYATLFLDVDERILSLGLLATLTLIALAGLEYSARLTVVLALIQVAGLLVVIAIGIPHIGEENLFEGNGATGILGASALVFFAFIGFDEVITLAEETENPRRTVPLALLAGLGGSTLLYVAVAVTAVSVLGANDLGASERPLADVLATAIGGGAEKAIAIVAMVATTNTTLLALTAASRITYGMAARDAFPRALSRVTRRSRTPFIAVIASALVAAAFAMLGDLRLIASTTDVAVYVVFIAVNLTVIILRIREPAAQRPFRSPLSIRAVPLLPILGIGATVLMMTGLERGSWLLGAGLVALGILAGLVLRARRNQPTPPPSP